MTDHQLAGVPRFAHAETAQGHAPRHGQDACRERGTEALRSERTHAVRRVLRRVGDVGAGIAGLFLVVVLVAAGDPLGEAEVEP